MKMGSTDLSFYFIGFIVCLAVMTAAFAAAGFVYFRFRPARNRKDGSEYRRAYGKPADFRITEHVISVNTKHSI